MNYVHRTADFSGFTPLKKMTLPARLRLVDGLPDSRSCINSPTFEHVEFLLARYEGGQITAYLDWLGGMAIKCLPGVKRYTFLVDRTFMARLTGEGIAPHTMTLRRHGRRQHKSKYEQVMEALV